RGVADEHRGRAVRRLADLALPVQPRADRDGAGDGRPVGAAQGPTDQTGQAGPRDATTEAVQAQVAALGCAPYEVGIRDSTRGTMTVHGPWTGEEVVQAVPWLKRMNALDKDSY